jgi:hypothetical protein
MIKKLKSIGEEEISHLHGFAASSVKNPKKCFFINVPKFSLAMFFHNVFTMLESY